MRLGNLTVGRRLALLSCIGGLIAGLIGGTAYLNASMLSDENATRTQIEDANAELIVLDKLASETQIAERDELLATNDAQRKAAVTALESLTAAAQTSWATITGLALPTAISDQLGTLNGDYATYLDEVKAQMPILAPIDPSSAAAGVALDRERSRASALKDKITAARATLAGEAATAQQHTAALITATKAMVLTVGLAGIAVLLIIAVVVTRSITRPLAAMVGALRSVADRDLSVKIDIRGRDEVAAMGHALMAALSALRTAIVSIGASSTTVSQASAELNTVSTRMGGDAQQTSDQAGLVAQAAEEVSANVQTMSSATEEMGAAINEISRHATDAAGVAVTAVGAVQQTSAAVGRLNEASAEIGDIVKNRRRAAPARRSARPPASPGWPPTSTGWSAASLSNRRPSGGNTSRRSSARKRQPRVIGPERPTAGHRAGNARTAAAGGAGRFVGGGAAGQARCRTRMARISRVSASVCRSRIWSSSARSAALVKVASSTLSCRWASRTVRRWAKLVRA